MDAARLDPDAHPVERPDRPERLRHLDDVHAGVPAVPRPPGAGKALHPDHWPVNWLTFARVTMPPSGRPAEGLMPPLFIPWRIALTRAWTATWPCVAGRTIRSPNQAPLFTSDNPAAL